MTHWIFWDEVDNHLRKSLKLYKEIFPYKIGQETKYREAIAKKPLFIDLIIRLIIARGFAKATSRQVLTAEKLLKSA
jgi:hypothetical protein